MIAATISEEASWNITPTKTYHDALNKMKDLYDPHLKLEVIQLLLKLFNLELKELFHGGSI